MRYIRFIFAHILVMACLFKASSVVASNPSDVPSSLSSSVDERLSAQQPSARGFLQKIPSLDTAVSSLNSSYKSKNTSLNGSQKPQQPRDIGMIGDEVHRLRARSLDRLLDRLENAAWLQENGEYLKKLVEAQKCRHG